MCVAYFMQDFIVNSSLAQGDDAEEFNPDRFIDENGQLSCSIPETKDGASFSPNHRNI